MVIAKVKYRLKKNKSGNMDLEVTEKMQNVFKSNVNKILKGRYKSDKQRSALKILDYFTKHKKLLLNYLATIL